MQTRTFSYETNFLPYTPLIFAIIRPGIFPKIVLESSGCRLTNSTLSFPNFAGLIFGN